MIPFEKWGAPLYENLCSQIALKYTTLKRLKRKTLYFLILGFVGSVISACSEKPKSPWLESTYRPGPPLNLDVVQVDIEKTYISPTEAPFVDHTLTPSPLEMTERWAQRYLVATGRVGRAVVRILEASIVEHIEERGKKPSIPYTGRLEVRIDFYGPDGNDQGFTTASVTRTHYIPFELSVPDRQKALKTMVEEMFGSLEPLVQENIYKHTPTKLLP